MMGRYGLPSSTYPVACFSFLKRRQVNNATCPRVHPRPAYLSVPSFTYRVPSVTLPTCDVHLINHPPAPLSISESWCRESPTTLLRAGAWIPKRQDRNTHRQSYEVGHDRLGGRGSLAAKMMYQTFFHRVNQIARHV